MGLSLATPPKIQELQKKLYLKAKEEPTFRFYTWYDKVYRADILAHAYALAQENKGAPGVDGKTFEDIEAYGVQRFLEEVARELREDTYRPEAVRRVMIPKANGGERPLGIPTMTRRGSGSQGTPQGGVISPLLANIYLRRFLKAWEQRGYEHSLKTRIVNYAGDFVILCRGTAPQAPAVARDLLTRIGLTRNEAKTRICRVGQESFDFLGYTFGRCYSPRTGNSYLGVQPSRKRLARLRDRIRELTGPGTSAQEDVEMIGSVNQVLRGWQGYFSYGTLWKAYRAVDAHVRGCVRHWLTRKHKIPGRGTRQYPDARLHGELGLYSLRAHLAGLRTPRV